MSSATRLYVILAVVTVIYLAPFKMVAQEPTATPKISSNAGSSTQVGSSNAGAGKELSEFQYSFWRLTKLESTSADFSEVIIEIGRQDISFSTVSYFASYPFQYSSSGLELNRAWKTDSSKNDESGREKQMATLFSDALRKTNSYDFHRGTLSFFGKDQQPIVVLHLLEQHGIENRRWRIAKYLGDGSKHGDVEGLVDATEPAEITLMHGRVDGSPGCGGWSGTYRLSSGDLTVEPQFFLAGLCYAPGLAQDGLVEKAFKGELRIEEKGNDILLRDMTGKARIMLVPYSS